ncbi:hypothetical protein ElyMa_004923200 [Elysia marginata]|uniref:Uncharacterized protein n=1 Tax=Elysia marginata TaxID=1093978 RepID=A0AAV4J0T9_9GAST|nr:hypothetical protein ElyMa_004923200 [Elysia marginata]
MEMDHQWNVFVPQQMLNEPSGFLLGYVDFDNALVYICGISNLSQSPHNVEPLGIWRSSCGDAGTFSKMGSTACWISMNIEEGKTHCLLLVKGLKGLLEQKPAVCVTFHPSEVMDSYILDRHSSQVNCNGRKYFVATDSFMANNFHGFGPQATMALPTESENRISAKFKRQDFVKTLMKMLNKTHSTMAPSANVKFFYRASKKHSQASSCVPLFLVWILSFFEHILKTGIHGIRICCMPFPKILQTPSTFQYLQDKVYRYKSCLSLERSNSLNNFL